MSEKTFEDKLLEKATEYLDEKEPNLSVEEKIQIKDKIISNFKTLRGIERSISSNEHGLINCVGGDTNEFLCNSNESCINSHTVAENQTDFIGGDDQKSEVMSLVNGVTSYFENGTTHCLLPVATKRASSFYGFCNKCETLFGKNSIDNFEKITIENFCLFFYRHVGRDIRLNLASVKKHQNYINSFTNDKEYPFIENFWKWLTNDSGNSLLETVEKEIRKLSLMVPSIEKDFIGFWASHQDKKIIENNGSVTQYQNYKMYEIKTDLDGFCIGSIIFPIAHQLYNENEYILQSMFVVFGVIEGKQVVKIFAHEKNWQGYAKTCYSSWQSSNLKFIHFLIAALMHPRPNMYFNKIYKHKITNCLNYMKENEMYCGEDRFIKDISKKSLNDIFRIINTNK